MPLPALDMLFDANPSQAKAISSVYEILLGGVPTQAGYTFLINENNSTNFGAGPGTTFNDENTYINIANALVQGNTTAAANFSAIAGTGTTAEKITNLYNAIVPTALQTDAGRAYLTSDANIAFYTSVAAARGVAGADGPAIIALGSLLKIAVDDNFGVGNAVNDLILAVNDGSAMIPETGTTFTPIETADGTARDADDNAAGGTFNFTVNQDSLTGTGADDTFNGPAGTLATEDSADGGAGTDTLKANLGGGTQAPGLTNIENIFISGGGTLDLVKSSGYNQLWADSSVVNFNNVQNLKDQTLGAIGVATVNAQLLSGSPSGSDPLKVALDGATGTVNVLDSGGTNQNDEINTLSLSVVGGKNSTLANTGTFTDLAMIDIAMMGDGKSNLGLGATGSTDLTSVNGSTLTGGLTVDVSTTTQNVSVSGGMGNDTITGSTTKNSSLTGGKGDDILTGQGGNDTISGGEGVDTILGGAGIDNIDGGDGNDTMDGDAGNDTLVGGAGNDLIDQTGAANAAGVDTMTGGAGNDVFGVVSDSPLVETNADVITDFVRADDSIDFQDAAGVAGLATNYAEAAVAVADYAAAITAANAALGGAIVYSEQQVGANTYIFLDVNGSGAVDAGDDVVELTGVAATGVDFNDIIA